jgi:hypothetical protein
MNDGAFFFEPRPKFFILTVAIVTLIVQLCQHVIQLPVWQRLKREAWEWCKHEFAHLQMWRNRIPTKQGSRGIIGARDDETTDVELVANTAAMEIPENR